MLKKQDLVYFYTDPALDNTSDASNLMICILCYTFVKKSKKNYMFFSAFKGSNQIQIQLSEKPDPDPEIED